MLLSERRTIIMRGFLMKPSIKNISSLILLVGFYVASYSAVMADTYIYEGKNFSMAATGAYDSTMNVTGTITTSVPIPDNSVDFDIGTIATSWTFFDGVQTIDNTNGVFHPNSFLRPKFTTNGSGQVTFVKMLVVKPPVAVTTSQFNDLIGIVSNLRDDAILQAPCINVTGPTCASYSTNSVNIGVAPPGGTWTRLISLPPPPAGPSTTPIPALGAWGLLLMSLVLGLFGVVVVRRMS